MTAFVVADSFELREVCGGATRRVLQGVLLEKQRATPEAAQDVVDNADFVESLLLVSIELVRLRCSKPNLQCDCNRTALTQVPAVSCCCTIPSAGQLEVRCLNIYGAQQSHLLRDPMR